MIDRRWLLLRLLLTSVLVPIVPRPASTQELDDAAQAEAVPAPNAQQLQESVRRERDGAIDSASVSFDGRVLFAVRGIPGFPAAERADGITERIRRIARDRSFDVANLRTRDVPLGAEILAGDSLLLIVTDLDAALVGITGRDGLAGVYINRIRGAVERYRAEREPGTLLFGALYALGATLVLVLTLLALRWLYRKSIALQRRHRGRVKDISVKSAQLVRAHHIHNTISGAVRAAFGVTALILIYAYLEGVLSLFPWTRGLARGLLQHVLNPLEAIALGVVDFIPNLIFILVLALATRLLLKGLKIFFTGVAEGTVPLGGFEPEWAWPTYRLLRLLVVAFFVIVAYPYLPGSDSAAFKGVSIFLGVVFSLGSSSVIGNLIAGYTMTYRRTFKVGDRVSIGDVVGDVEQIRLLVTHIRSPKNEEIVVPNSLIIGSNVVNFSSIARKEGLILHTTVGIGYEVPWRQVEAMLIEAAARTQGLRADPPPFVLQKSLGDFCVSYELNAYCSDPGRMYELYSQLHRNIQDVFNEYGVQIMTPAYEGDPAEPKVVARDHWYEPPARPDGTPADLGDPTAETDVSASPQPVP